ncbi:response regulator [Kitasatospora indigofera]|uniref:response regulator n=1 Tax=Kitasatospora indigofera TaxID=67307 RepID=UPI0036899B2C
MGELRPLSAELNEECRAFAEALRSVFAGLDVSVRRYGARRFISAGTISRYLSGARIPPWEFVLDLLKDVAAHRGMPATPEAIDLVRGLHQAAMRTNASMSEAVQQLQYQLAEADRESRRSAVQSDVLGDALLDKNHRIADLEIRINQLEADWARDRARADEVALRIDDRESLLGERDRLAAEVRRLEVELEEARLRGLAADSRCELLERQLIMAEQQIGADPVHYAGLPAAGFPAGDVEGTGRPKVLLVDDQPANLLALETVLAVADCELLSVTSGDEALKALLQHDDIAVIILDVQMPDMDGYQTAAHIKRRAHTRNIPIIFLTAIGTSTEHFFRGYALGAVDFLVKPCDPWILRAKVTAFTEMHVANRIHRQAPPSEGESIWFVQP